MIRRARKSDLKSINALMEIAHFLPIEKPMLRDLCLVSVHDDRVMGFIWASISYSRYLAYVDFLVVHPEAKGDGIKLCAHILKEFHRMRVKKIMTVVEADGSEFSNRSYRINENIGLLPHPSAFNLFTGETERMMAKWVE